MSQLCTFKRENGDICIRRSDRNEIMFTTFREDYWNELTSQTWRLDAKGYPACAKFGTLHRYIMGKWYGNEVLEDLTTKGFVVDHIDNKHSNCRVSNLEFLKKDFNTAKGQWPDKQVEEKRFHFALSIFKDFETAGRTDFKNLSKSDVLSYTSMLKEMRPEVAAQVIAQFPEYASLVIAALGEYREILGKVISSDDGSLNRVYDLSEHEMQSSDESRKQFFDLAGRVQADLSKCLDRSDLSLDERKPANKKSSRIEADRKS